MTKRKIGWLFLALVVIGALGFAGYQFYREKTAENRREAVETYNRKLNALYSDQKTGYFKSTITNSDFDHLLNDLDHKKSQDPVLAETVQGAKKDFQLQNSVNQLFEEDVLNGINLNAHPVLQKPDTDRKIPALENQLSASSASTKNWGQDLKVILALADTQATDYETAQDSVARLARKKTADISLTDYLSTVKTVAVLPDGTYKTQQLSRLDPIKTKLSQGNETFAAEIQQKEAAINEAAQEYQARQAKELEAKTDELNSLKKELAQKQQTYASLSRMKVALEASRKASSERNRSRYSIIRGSSSSTSSTTDASFDRETQESSQSFPESSSSGSAPTSSDTSVPASSASETSSTSTGASHGATPPGGSVEQSAQQPS